MIQQSNSWVYIQKKTFIQKVTCTPILIAVVFTTAKTWKKLKCPLTDEWIKKMWYIYTVGKKILFYSAIKKNKIMPFAATRMELEILILSDVSQKRTNTI